MLGLGWTEMLVIGVVALIVIGPKDLPIMMRRVGQFAGTIRRMGSEFQRELNKTTGLDEIRNLRSSLTEPLRKTTDEIRREFNRVTPTGVQPTGAIKPVDPKVESVVDEIKSAAGMKTEPAKALPAPKVDEAKTVASPAAGRSAKSTYRKPVAKAKPAPTAKVTKTELPAIEPAVENAAKAAPRKTGTTGKPTAAAKKPAAKPKASAAETAAEPSVVKKPAARRAKPDSKS